MGGGGTNLNSSSASSNKSKFFKPVVASSLALFLTAGIASAQCNGTATGSSAKICYGTQAGQETDKTSSFTDLKLEADSTSGIVIPKSTNGTEQAITTLAFRLNGTGTGTTDPSGAFDNGTYTITANQATSGTPTEQHFILDGQGKAIQMGADGTGKLSVDFGDGTNDRTFTLQLGQTTGDFAFKGNIDVVNDETSKTARTNATLTATFGKDMQGNITIGEKALSDLSLIHI